MKKTLVALAALAALGTASAQVTVYGKVDLGVSSKTTTGGVDQGLEITSGNYEGSRFGIKASHDLTGGLKLA
jgi:predicted porin